MDTSKIHFLNTNITNNTNKLLKPNEFVLQAKHEFYEF